MDKNNVLTTDQALKKAFDITKDVKVMLKRLCPILEEVYLSVQEAGPAAKRAKMDLDNEEVEEEESEGELSETEQLEEDKDDEPAKGVPELEDGEIMDEDEGKGSSEAEPEPLSTECPICSKTFKTFRAKQKHMICHTKIPCDICGKVLLASSIRRHSIRVHGTSPARKNRTEVPARTTPDLDQDKVSEDDDEIPADDNTEEEVPEGEKNDESLANAEEQVDQELEETGQDEDQEEEASAPMTKKESALFHCPFCPKAFPTLWSQELHVTKLHTKLPCDICGKVISAKYLKFHKIKVHKIAETNGKLANPLLTPQQPSVKHEITNEETPEEDVAEEASTDSGNEPDKPPASPSTPAKKSELCQKCDKVFYDENLLALHMTFVHKPSLVTSSFETKSPQKVPCHQCDQSFGSKDRLALHMKLAHRILVPFECFQCGRELADFDSLNLHKEQEHQEEPPHECQRCDKRFWSRFQLYSHCKAHHYDDHFYYPLCLR